MAGRILERETTLCQLFLCGQGPVKRALRVDQYKNWWSLVNSEEVSYPHEEFRSIDDCFRAMVCNERRFLKLKIEVMLVQLYNTSSHATELRKKDEKLSEMGRELKKWKKKERERRKL